MALTQLVIDVGAAPNDGEGDPIRTAFIKTNDNFTELYSIPNTTPPSTPKGKFGDQPGMYAYSSGYFYYCFGIYDNINAIWGTVVSDANVSSTKIQNGNSNVSIPTLNGNVIISVNGNANSAVFSEGKLAVEGGITSNSLYSTANVSAGAYLLGDGGFISNVAVNYSNANVGLYLQSYTGNLSAGNISAGGNVTATNMNVANAIIATTFIGNVQGNITGNLVVPGSNTWVLYNNGGNAGSDIGFTYNAATKNLTVGNTVTANFFVGDGSQLTNVASSYGNAQVEAYLPSSNTIIAINANVSNTNGNVANLTTALGNTNSNVANTNANVANTNSNVGNVASNVATLQGQVYANANVSAYLPIYSGNVGNLNVTGNMSAVTAANGTNTTQVATTAFVTNAVTTANGYGNVDVSYYLPTYTGNLVSLGGVVSTTANVIGANLVTSGNTSANNFIGNSIVSSGNLTLTASSGNTTQVTGGTFRLPSFTTAEIANLTGVGGDMVYNTDLNIVQAYQMNPATSTMGWVGWTVAVYQ